MEGTCRPFSWKTLASGLRPMNFAKNKWPNSNRQLEIECVERGNFVHNNTGHPQDHKLTWTSTNDWSQRCHGNELAYMISWGHQYPVEITLELEWGISADSVGTPGLSIPWQLAPCPSPKVSPAQCDQLYLPWSTDHKVYGNCLLHQCGGTGADEDFQGPGQHNFAGPPLWHGACALPYIRHCGGRYTRFSHTLVRDYITWIILQIRNKFIN